MRKALTCLLIALAVIVTGCTITGSKPGSGGIGYVKIPFEKVEPDQAPEAVARELEAMQARAGTKTVVLDGATYAMVTLGKASSGGWEVVVESVGEAQGRVEVVYRVKAPAPGSNQTTAITYPSVVVKFTAPAGLPIQFKEAK